MAENLYVHSVANGFLYYEQDGSKNYPVSDRVNPKYIKPGMSEVTVKEGIVTFIKPIQERLPVAPPLNQIAPASAPVKTESNYRTPKSIARQACLDSAISITPQTDKVTVEQIKKVAQELYEWVMTE